MLSLSFKVVCRIENLTSQYHINQFSANTHLVKYGPAQSQLVVEVVKIAAMALTLILPEISGRGCVKLETPERWRSPLLLILLLTLLVL